MFVRVVIFSGLTFFSGALGSLSLKAQEIGSIPASGYLAIQAAMPAFNRAGLSLRGYEITVIEADGKIGVAFTDPRAPLGSRGTLDAMLKSFSVERRKENLKIIQSYFSK
jgi:hypothetical protein